MNIKDFINGWFIGNFEPSIVRTKSVEIAYQKGKKGEPVPKHYQRVSTEYNLLVKGKMQVNGKEYNEGDFFIFEPYVVCEVEFLEDSEIVVVKMPSVGAHDKVVVK